MSNTKEDVRVTVERIIRRIRLHKTVEGFTDEQIETVIDEAMATMSCVPALVEIEAPVIVFGDVHGQLNDLLRFWTIVGEPPSVQWLYLGDYIDRCKKGLEVILLLLCYKIKFPQKVHVLRGNHECQKTNRIYGFYMEMKIKRNTRLWLKFNKLFNEFPLCASISSRILCMHGGISKDIFGWDTLKNLKKARSVAECDEGVAVDLMWADPTNDVCGFDSNKARRMRCTSIVFGSEAIENMCKTLDIGLIVRAHEAVHEGHQFFHNNLLCTIFSAPNYCGNDGNCASVLHITAKLELSFTTLRPNFDTSKLPQDVLLRMQRYQDVKSPSAQPGPRKKDVQLGGIHEDTDKHNSSRSHLNPVSPHDILFAPTPVYASPTTSDRVESPHGEKENNRDGRYDNSASSLANAGITPMPVSPSTSDKAVSPNEEKREESKESSCSPSNAGTTPMLSSPMKTDNAPSPKGEKTESSEKKDPEKK